MESPERISRLYTWILVISIVIILGSAFAAVYKVITTSNLYLSGGFVRPSIEDNNVVLYFYLYFTNPNIAHQEVVGGYMRVYFQGKLVGVVPITSSVSVPPKGSSTLIVKYSLPPGNPNALKIRKGGSWYVIVHVKIHQPFGYYSKVFSFSCLSKPIG